MIRVRDLTRKYGDFLAVDAVSFDIGEGEIVGLLGHNGAGKTTIMKMLTGYLEPTAGSVVIDGVDIEEDREAVQATVGYLPENCPVYPDMAVVDYLHYAAELKGLPAAERAGAIAEAMAATDLTERAGEPIARLSRGYRQRVGVAQAILHRPKIVILDEPTNGLDPSQILHMRDLIRRLAQTSTVILSTHILQEVQAVCGRVIIIDRGRVALDSPLDKLQREGRLRLLTPAAPEAVEKAVAALDLIEGVETVAGDGDVREYGVKLNGAAPEVVAPRVARALHDNGLDLVALYPDQRDLESVFAEISARAAPRREAVHA